MRNHLGGFHAAGFLLAVVTGLLPFSSGAGIVLKNPAPGAVVSTRSPQMQRFLSVDMAEALEIFQDKKQRAELRAHRDCVPVTFSWCVTDGETGPFRVHISEREDLSEAAPLFIGEAGPPDSVTVANFEPGKRYFWKVTGKDKNGHECSSEVGSFSAADELPRQMYIPDIPNMRDLGGRTGLYGRRIRCGLLFRSAGMNDNSPEMIADQKLVRNKKLKRSDITKERTARYRPGKNRITDAGHEYLDKVIRLRTDLDLRSVGETGNANCSPAGKNVRFVNISFTDYDNIFKAKNYPAAAEVFRVFCDKDNYPVVFHCIGGADRTGAVTCILLGVLGVAAESLTRDWLMTANPHFDIGKWTALIEGFAGYAPPGAPLDKQIEGYLHAVGITDEEIETFRAMMLENHPAPASERNAFPAEFTVACVNCGCFHYGDKAIPEAIYRDNWKKMVKNADADVFFFEDFGKKFTTGKDPAAKLDICHLAKLPPDEVAVLPLPREINGRKTPRYRALRLCWSVNGRRIAFYGVHLVAEGHIPGKTRDASGYTPSQQLRKLQFAELIGDAKKYDLAVLCGDFNAQKPEEYDIFTKHDFTLTNCSERFGTHASLRNIPADNIIVSPGLEIVDFRLLREPELDTDHIPLKAVIRFKE